MMRMPPEWHPQDWLWIGFPHLAEEWSGVIDTAQAQIAAFASAVAESGQEVRLIVRDEANAARAAARQRLCAAGTARLWRCLAARYRAAGGARCGGNRRARLFGFNGWGGKYLMDGDTLIGADLADSAGWPPTVATGSEGGALDGDGTGLVATTGQCLLNPNRNPHLAGRSRSAAGARSGSTGCCGWAMA
jgi:agmatine deiminase